MKYHVMVLSLLSAGLIGSTSAAAQTACSAAQVSAQEAGCPAAGACVITKSFTLPSDCTFDFGSRSVTMTPTARFTVGSNSLMLMAGSLTIQPRLGPSIDARGSGATAPTNSGGSVTITTSGAVTLQKSGAVRAAIDVSANLQAGSITITSGDTVTVNGALSASQLVPGGSGGNITIAAAKDVISASGSSIDATGGVTSINGGGDITIDAGGKLDFGDIIDVTGSNAGNIDLSSGGDFISRGIRGNGNGDGGDGATVTVEAGGAVQILAPILLRGSDSNATAGGGGGTLGIDALGGSFVMNAAVFAEGAGPDGDGGEVDFTSTGDFTLANGIALSVSSNGDCGSGGTICIEASLSAFLNGNTSADGGISGGCIDIASHSDMSISGSITSKGFFAAGQGGDINIEAGLEAFGGLTISGTLNVGGGPCGIDGCGDAGSIELAACALNVTNAAMLFARAPGSGGTLQFTAREQATINGTVNALGEGSGGADGGSVIIFPDGKPPVVKANAIAPVALLQSMPRCTAAGQADCLVPCPTCGNGVIEFPEVCDGGNAANCDGCSHFCQIETCGPNIVCSAACDPLLGCGLISGCTPTPTITPTFTVTRTGTATQTLRPSATGTPTATVPAIATLTITPTTTIVPSASSTLTATSTPLPPTATKTPTATTTITATTIPSATNTATKTVTVTATSTASPTASISPTVAAAKCVGDCHGDGEVTVDELLSMVNIALGSAPVSGCLAGDGNGDGEITIDEILSAVNAALNGCPMTS